MKNAGEAGGGGQEDEDELGFGPEFGVLRRISFEQDGDAGYDGGGGGGGGAAVLRRSLSSASNGSSDGGRGGLQGLLDDITRFQNEILKEQVSEADADFIFVSAHQSKGLEWPIVEVADDSFETFTEMGSDAH